MKTSIDRIWAQEILDSRGNPTVHASVILTGGETASASVPSGASVGRREALELRDKDRSRFIGEGVLKAVSNIHTILSPGLVGLDVLDQRKIDETMCELDGTPDKANLGANAILAVSLAAARAAAAMERVPLYAYIRRLCDIAEQEIYTLPVPMINVLNGGQHTNNGLEFQEFMLYPHGASSFQEALRFSTQYSGEGIDEQFERKETGQAVRRRLNEFCKVVVVREQRASKHLCSSEM